MRKHMTIQPQAQTSFKLMACHDIHDMSHVYTSFGRLRARWEKDADTIQKYTRNSPQPSL